MPVGIGWEATETVTDSLFDEVAAGFSEDPRRLPPKLFYDERGAALFRRITELDAYYLTRTEIGILRERLPTIAAHVGPCARVVEFGTGDGRKLGMLLDALDHPAECVPIDISKEQLLALSDQLRETRPSLRVHPLPLDYTRPFELPEPRVDTGRVLFFFPGSTLGNFEPDQAARFLEGVARAGGAGSLLVIGVDLVKPPHVLERAYDDELGVTAAFNLNALHHLNRSFEANFDPSAFRHRAIWNADASRIEMRLVCTRTHTVTLRERATDVPVRAHLQKGDEVVTEHSYKYRPRVLSELFTASGWRPLHAWTDDRRWFSVSLLQAGER